MCEYYELLPYLKGQVMELLRRHLKFEREKLYNARNETERRESLGRISVTEGIMLELDSWIYFLNYYKS